MLNNYNSFNKYSALLRMKKIIFVSPFKCVNCGVYVHFVSYETFSFPKIAQFMGKIINE